MNPITSITLTFADGTTQSFSEQAVVAPVVDTAITTDSTGAAPIVSEPSESTPEVTPS